MGRPDTERPAQYWLWPGPGQNSCQNWEDWLAAWKSQRGSGPLSPKHSAAGPVVLEYSRNSSQYRSSELSKPNCRPTPPASFGRWSYSTKPSDRPRLMETAEC